jgi:nitrogen fixation protein FixH
MTMVQTNAKEPKPITGKTVLAWLIGFFAVIFIANAIFIYLALGSFPGVVVESSYEAGQNYNSEIAAAKAQERLNWQVASEFVPVGETGHQLLVTAADAEGTPLYGVDVQATLQHPAQQTADVEVILNADGGGRYVGTLDKVYSGNWTLVLEIEQDGKRVFKSENRIFLKD